MVAGYYSLELETENFQHPGITGHHVGVADTNGFPFRRNYRLSPGIDGEQQWYFLGILFLWHQTTHRQFRQVHDIPGIWIGRGFAFTCVGCVGYDPVLENGPQGYPLLTFHPLDYSIHIVLHNHPYPPIRSHHAVIASFICAGWMVNICLDEVCTSPDNRMGDGRYVCCDQCLLFPGSPPIPVRLQSSSSTNAIPSKHCATRSIPWNADRCHPGDI